MKDNRQLIAFQSLVLATFSYLCLSASYGSETMIQPSFSYPALSNREDSMRPTTHYRFSHNKALDFSDQTLDSEDIITLERGRYEEVDLSSTNIANLGLQHLAGSQETLSRLDTENTFLDSRNAQLLSGFKNLQYLNLGNNRLTDADMDYVGTLTYLQELNIQHNYITAVGLQKLSSLKSLETLDCGFMPLGNKGIQTLTQFSKLSHLAVRSAGFNEEALPYLASLPQLKTVDISYNKISKEALEAFVKQTKAQVIANHME